MLSCMGCSLKYDSYCRKYMNNNQEILDVVIISTMRPELLKITLNSFSNKMLKGIRCRAIVNVDPVGDSNCYQEDIVSICEEYFDVVVSRTPSKPSFSEAVQWCWSQVESAVFLHLEDDWCLKRYVNFNDVLKLFQDRDVVSVRLNLTGNRKFPSYNGVVYDNRLSLNPSVFKTIYIKGLLVKFDVKKDPEKQFINNFSTYDFAKPRFLVFGSIFENAYVIDTGKKWRKSLGLLKWDQSGEADIIWRKQDISFVRAFLLRLKFCFFIYFWSKVYCKNL